MAPAEPRGEAGGEAGGPPVTEHQLRAWLAPRLAELAGIPVDEVDPTATFSSYGVDSAAAAELLAGLEVELGRELEPTVVFSFESPAELAAHLAAGGGAPRARPRPRVATSRRDRHEREPIAVVGIGCRLPGGDGPEGFWQLLDEGRDAVGEVPAGRWDDADVPPDLPARARLGGFVDGLDRFDPGFFGISQLEADRMDPQQRLLLEVAWEALEDAEVPPSQLRGAPVGVFVGISTNEYSRRQGARPELVDVFFGTGNALSIAANRVSYAFDLRGPSVAVDTACSSSLVAVHLACAAIRRGECTTALAGGSNALLTPLLTLNFTDAGVIAPDGRCKTFDASADGIVRGEGAALVVLKPLSRARADGDRIYCVVEGSATNSDGRSNGLTAPNPDAQVDVFVQALADAGVDPADVGYVEAHGTGTVLGDAMELQSLDAVYGAGRDADRPLLVGSVKTNIGHLESGAGIAGLVKVALALHHGRVPPTLHFREPNPYLDRGAPVRVVDASTPWPADGTARAAVSGFGFGGTNAHLVVGPSPVGDHHHDPGRAAPADRDGAHAVVVPVSARSSTSLAATAGELADRIEAAPGSLADLAAAVALTRDEHPRRAAVVATGADDAVAALRSLGAGRAHRQLVVGERRSTEAARVVFVCSGQGRAWWPFDPELLADPVIRSVLEQCDSEMRDLAGWSVMDLLRSGEPVLDHERAQPLLYALQVALAARWRAFGVEPDLVMGQSIGEIAAAQVVGSIRLAEGLEIVLNRGRFMEESNGTGHTGFVELPADEAAAMIAELGVDVSIAAVTAPDNCLVSGPKPDMVTAIEAASARGVMAQIYTVGDIPGHGPLMAPYADKLSASIDFLEPRPNRVPLVSTVTAELIDGEELGPAYWGRNLRQAVRFADGVATAVREGGDLFIEVAPHPVVGVSIKRCLEALGARAAVTHTVKQGQPGDEALRRAVATAWAAGAPVDWRAVSGRSRAAVAAPRYRWDRRRCWFEAPADGSAPAAGGPAWHPLVGDPTDLGDGLGTTTWPVRPPQGGTVTAGVVVEVAAAAAGRVLGADAVTVDDVDLAVPPPAIGDGGLRLTTTSSVDGTVDWRLAVVGDGPPRSVARGTAAPLDDPTDTPVLPRSRLAPEGGPVDVEALAASLEVPVAGADALLGATAGPDGAVARLRDVPAVSPPWVVAPAVLDAALAASLLLSQAPPAGSAVGRIARVAVRRTPPAGARAVVDGSDSGVVVVDEWGAPVVELAGVVAGAGGAGSAAGTVLVEHWEERGVATSPGPGRRWAVVAVDGDPLGADLLGRLDADVVAPADVATWVDAAAGRPAGIVVLDPPPGHEDAGPSAGSPAGPGVTTALAAALGSRPDADLRCYVVTRGGRGTPGDRRVRAAAAATLAGVAPLRRDVPGLRPTSVDLPADGGDPDALAAELLADAPDDAVVLAGGSRLVGRLVEAPVPAAPRRAGATGDAPLRLTWGADGRTVVEPAGPAAPGDGETVVQAQLAVLGRAECSSPLAGRAAGVAAVGRAAGTGAPVVALGSGTAATTSAVAPDAVVELRPGTRAEVAAAALARLDAALGDLGEAVRRDPGMVRSALAGLLSPADGATDDPAAGGWQPVRADQVDPGAAGPVVVRIDDPDTEVVETLDRGPVVPGSRWVVLDAATTGGPTPARAASAWLERRGAATELHAHDPAGGTDLADAAVVRRVLQGGAPAEGVVWVVGDVVLGVDGQDGAPAATWVALTGDAPVLGTDAVGTGALGAAAALVAARRAAGGRAALVAVDAGRLAVDPAAARVLDRLVATGTDACWSPTARAQLAEQPGPAAGPWLRELARAPVGDDGSRPLPVLLAATPADRLVDVVAGLVGAELAAIVGIEPDELDPDTPVIDYGVDSLVGMELRSRIESGWHHVVPLSELSRTMTVRELATHLAAEAVPGLVRLAATTAAAPGAAAASPAGAAPAVVRAVPVRTAGGRPSFWVPGIFGAPEALSPLAAALHGLDVWSFRAPGLEGDRTPAASVDALARSYVAGMRAEQPRGPYLLGGYSFGAVVAVRMCELLEADGEQVERLWLLDPPPPVDSPEQDRTGRTVELLGRHLGDLFPGAGGGAIDAAELPPPGGGADVGPLARRIVRDSATPLDADAVADVLGRLWTVVGASLAAMAEHRPTATLAAPVTLVRAGVGDTTGPPDAGAGAWVDHVAAPPDVAVVDADHVGLLRPPHVAGVAAIVEATTGSGPTHRPPQRDTTMTSTDTTATDVAQASRLGQGLGERLLHSRRVRNAVGAAGSAYRTADFFLRALAAERRFRRQCTAGEGLIVGERGQITNLTGDPSRVRMGHHCLIDGFLNIQEHAYFSMGSYCGIGEDVRIDCAGYVEIGNGCTLAEGVYVIDGLHHPILANDRIAHGIDLFEGDHVMDAYGPGTETSFVRIEDLVWVGLRAIVLSGVTIGRGSVVAAGAVVSSDVPPFSVVAGNPGRVVGRIPHEEFDIATHPAYVARRGAEPLPDTRRDPHDVLREIAARVAARHGGR